MEQDSEAVMAAEAPAFSSGFSEAVRDELLDECEVHFEALQKVVYPIIFNVFKYAHIYLTELVN